MLNVRDMDVLNILWKSDEAMMATDIVNVGEGLTQSTVTAVLRKLLKDELIEVVGITHSGRVLSRIYRPTEKSRKVLLDSFLGIYNCFSSVIPEAELCMEILTKGKEPEYIKSEICKFNALMKEYEKGK